MWRINSSMRVIKSGSKNLHARLLVEGAYYLNCVNFIVF